MPFLGRSSISPAGFSNPGRGSEDPLLLVYAISRTFLNKSRAGFSNPGRGSEDPLLLVYAISRTFLYKSRAGFSNPGRGSEDPSFMPFPGRSSISPESFPEERAVRLDSKRQQGGQRRGRTIVLILKDLRLGVKAGRGPSRLSTRRVPMRRCPSCDLPEGHYCVSPPATPRTQPERRSVLWMRPAVRAAASCQSKRPRVSLP